MPSGSFAPWSVVVATPLCPLAVPAADTFDAVDTPDTFATFDTFDPTGCVPCTTVVVTGRETVPPATVCPCRARFVAAERREAADVVETEDNPETKPASAAACPKAPVGTAPRVKTSREPNTSFVLSIAIPLQLHHVRVISTQASPDAPRVPWTQSLLPKDLPNHEITGALFQRPAWLTTSQLKFAWKESRLLGHLFNLLLQFRSTGELC
jgi:hypothetical protein